MTINNDKQNRLDSEKTFKKWLESWIKADDSNKTKAWLQEWCQADISKHSAKGGAKN